jgi:hypothetical protein
MTNTELKNQIDTALNNSVADNSITPASVATQIKSVVDYVDQESGALYKRYRALLTQSGSNDPTAYVLENNLGETVILDRVGTGTYTLEIASGFISLKTFYKTNGFSGTNIQLFSFFNTITNKIVLSVRDMDNNLPIDNNLNNTPIEILVYN